MLRNSRVGAALAVLLTLAAGSMAVAQPTRIPLDQATTIAGVGVGCTGIGQTKSDPKWLAYSVRVEFAGPGGDLLANETLRVSDAKGPPLLAVFCEGPWILLMLPPGKTYKLDAQVGRAAETTVSGTVKSPRHGQASVVLTFPAG